MPFPGTIIDNFNRSDTPSGLGTDWGIYSIVNVLDVDMRISGFVATRITGNTVSGSVYLPSSSLLNAEMYFMMSGWPHGSFFFGSTTYMLARVQNRGSSTARALAIVISINDSASDACTLYFTELSGFTMTRQIAVSPVFNMAYGDRVACRIYERDNGVSLAGTVMEFWTERPAGSGAWTKRFAALDISQDRIKTPGPWGIGSTTQDNQFAYTLDDFSILGITSIPLTGINTETYPSYRGAFSDRPYLATLTKSLPLPGAGSWYTINDRLYLARRVRRDPSYSGVIAPSGALASRGGVTIFTRTT